MLSNAPESRSRSVEEVSTSTLTGS
jgi:hypothetical protein